MAVADSGARVVARGHDTGDEVQAHAVVSSGQGPLLVIVLRAKSLAAATCN